MNSKWDADRLRTRYSNTWRFYLSNEDTDTLDLRDFEINSGTVRGNDGRGRRRIKPIRNILFAFPVEKILDVRPHIEKAQPSKSVTKMQLKKGELRQALKKHIVLTMRGGYVIRGKLQKFDDDHLFMRVGNTDVQVYQHGLLNLEKKKVSSQIKTNDLRKSEKNEKVQKTTLKKRKFRQGDEHIPSDYKAIKVKKSLETIGVREVDETERIKMILKQRYTPRSIKPREADLERFIKLVEVDSSQAELFKSYPIFQIDKDLDNKEGWASPEKIFLDSPYLDTGLTAYYEAMETNSSHFRRPLSPKYAKSDIDLKRLGKFAKAVGVQTKLQVFKHEISEDHPQYYWLMLAPGGRLTEKMINEDYSIHEFEALFYKPSIDKAKLIWRTMSCAPESYLKAQFRRNQSNEPREAHSSLVHNLKETEWVPQKDSDSISFVIPREASIERLPEGFPYETGQKWFESIKFGEIAEKQKLEQIFKEREKSNQNQRAQEIGFSSGDEAETMVEPAKVLRAQGKSPEEMIDRLNTEKRRAERLTIQLSDAEEKQYEIRARSIRSTRNTIDSHILLRAQYTKFNNMECQMCRQEMPFKKRNSDDDYFEAVEALGKDYFPKEHEAQHLALCPECAAKYQEYVKNDKAAQKVLYDILKDSDEPEVRLELSDFAIHIWFDEKHWRDLKTILHYYENVYESENSTD